MPAVGSVCVIDLIERVSASIGYLTTDVRARENLTISTTDSSLLFAGAANGVFRSTDGGGSWT